MIKHYLQGFEGKKMLPKLCSTQSQYDSKASMKKFITYSIVNATFREKKETFLDKDIWTIRNESKS